MPTSELREMLRFARANESKRRLVLRYYQQKFGRTLVSLDRGNRTGRNLPPLHKGIFFRGVIWYEYMELFKTCIKHLEIIYTEHQHLNNDTNQYIKRNCTERLISLSLRNWNPRHCSMGSFINISFNNKPNIRHRHRHRHQINFPFYITHNVFNNVTSLAITNSEWTEDEFTQLPTYFPNVTKLVLCNNNITNYGIFFTSLEHLIVGTGGWIGDIAPIWQRNDKLRILDIHHLRPNASKPLIEMIATNLMIETLVVKGDCEPIQIADVDRFIQEHQALVKLHLDLMEMDYRVASNIMTGLKRLREFKYKVILPDGKDDIVGVMSDSGWRVIGYEDNHGITLQKNE